MFASQKVLGKGQSLPDPLKCSSFGSWSLYLRDSPTCTAKCTAQHQLHPFSKSSALSATCDFRCTGLLCARAELRGNRLEAEPAKWKNYNSRRASRELRATLYFITPPTPAAEPSEAPPQGFFVLCFCSPERSPAPVTGRTRASSLGSTRCVRGGS